MGRFSYAQQIILFAMARDLGAVKWPDSPFRPCVHVVVIDGGPAVWSGRENAADCV